MNDRPKYLFEGPSSHDLSRNLQVRAMDELKSQNENVILSTPTDDLVMGLLARYGLEFPELRDSETWLDEKEITSQVSNRGYDIFTDQHGGTRTVTSHVVSFNVPFTGDGSLFNISPSSRSIPGPAAEVKGQELIIRVATDRMTQERVTQEYDNQIQSIKQHLATLQNDLRTVTSQIESPARTYIEQRKAQLLKSKNLVASLGFPIKRRAETPTTFRPRFRL